HWKGSACRAVPACVSFPKKSLVDGRQSLAKAGRRSANDQRLMTSEGSTVLLTDKFGRPITDLRISITDRCNYRCVYCRTGNEGALYGDLPFADYLRMARVLVGMGVTKIRLTGGEPLLRKGVVEFVRELAMLRPQMLKLAAPSKLNG